ncbi:hypothetical protein FNH22_05090 [Fulvivirga sp. M361]|uniref:hypothetical protein n=1 Tax=Fulvivirga sp. M361 TaxID=2594266 RepID=UPI00117BC240|nr:hypothetical protein [Fulvivirga sp. M361]TRX61432.1 hypothetical protein FNH22_05090 [Fulvivirga sp. M361]
MLNVFQYLASSNRILAYGAMFFGLVSLVVLVLLPFETRLILGINLWIKPLKFAISIFIFLVTSIYILEPLPYSESKRSVMSWILLITMLVEIICILFQAARGQLSHFNITDPIGAIMFPLMGLAITIAYLVYGVILYDYFRLQVSLPGELTWAIRISIIIFLIGLISGFMMGSSLKHTIGMADGGPGLPFTNWSTVAGDLRVSHFISIHAIQVLPLLAISLPYILPQNFPIKNLVIICVSGTVYLGFTVATLLQALHGKPFIRI